MAKKTTKAKKRTKNAPAQPTAPENLEPTATTTDSPLEAPVAAEPAAGPVEPSSAPVDEAPAKPKRTRKSREPQAPKKLSALDAAAQVLAAEGRPMTAPELIAAMAERGLWSSPNGKTPAATLYAAILREITTKRDQSRFSRPERGKFAATSLATTTATE
jgi:hypothetical protein